MKRRGVARPEIQCHQPRSPSVIKREFPTGCAGRTQPAPGCAAWCPAATALLGLPGLMVTAVTQTGDGWTVVDVLTAPERAEAARCCPDCGVRAAVKETVTTTPRDVYLGDRQVLLRWRKRRRECENQDCQRKTFTESLPAVPPRARLTSRLRTRLGEAVGDDLMPAAAAARALRRLGSHRRPRVHRLRRYPAR